MSAILIPSMQYYGRDPATDDFTTGDFIKDSNYHDLDLSGIIPTGTKLVHLRGYVRADIAEANGFIRKKGDVNPENRIEPYTQVAAVELPWDGFVAADADRLIEYQFSGAVTWFDIYMTVRGWFL